MIGYMFLWAPAANLAARVGQYTSFYCWFFMPFVPIIYFLRNARRLITELVSDKGFQGMLWSAPIFGALAFLVVYFDLTRNKWAQIAFGVFIALFSLVFLYAIFTLFLLSYIKDKLRWFGQPVRLPAILQSNEFLQLLGHYSTGKFRLRLVKLIRKRGALEAVEESEDTVARLIIKIEKEQKRRIVKIDKALQTQSKDESNADSGQDAFDKWYKDHFKGLGDFSLDQESQVLDELSFLLEQIQARRRDRITQMSASS
jgi:hypothetical protein